MFAIASNIQHRVDETRKRPAAVESALTKLKEFEKKVHDLNKTMSWINETHKGPALVMIENLRAWIEEKTTAQSNKPLYEDPVFTVSLLEYRVKDVKEAYINLKNVKKPKEKKKTVSLFVVFFRVWQFLFIFRKKKKKIRRAKKIRKKARKMQRKLGKIKKKMKKM